MSLGAPERAMALFLLSIDEVVIDDLAKRIGGFSASVSLFGSWVFAICNLAEDALCLLAGSVRCKRTMLPEGVGLLTM
jgi:hypothetical protein